jgi:hypothetical protein
MFLSGCNNGAVFRVVRYVLFWVFRLDRLSWSRIQVVQNLCSYWLPMLQFSGQDYSVIIIVMVIIALYFWCYL